MALSRSLLKLEKEIEYRLEALNLPIHFRIDKFDLKTQSLDYVLECYETVPDKEKEKVEAETIEIVNKIHGDWLNDR